MKRLIYLCCLISLTVLSSCDKETYRHAIAVVYPLGINVRYADQIKDSIIFTTFDSYEVTPQSDWIKTNLNYGKASANINNAYYVGYNVTVGIDIVPNNTGKCRLGKIAIRSYCEDWTQTANAVYYQYSWHNIQRPSGIYSTNNGLYETSRFVMKESANSTSDSIKFTTYLDWDLVVPENSFVHPTKKIGKAGEHVVHLNLDENKSNKLDSVELKLITRDYGVVTPILVYRQPKTKD